MYLTLYLFLVLLLSSSLTETEALKINLSPQWGPEDPSGFQSSLCVCLSVRSFLCPFVRMFFGNHKSAAHNCLQRMRPQTTGSNPLSDSIIFPSICPSICPQAFFYFSILLISSVGVQHQDAFIPQTGAQRTTVGSS